jgi:hypothetical protein
MATQALVITQQERASERGRLAQVDQQLNQVQEIYRANDFSAPVDDPAEAQTFVLAEQEHLTRLERDLCGGCGVTRILPRQHDRYVQRKSDLSFTYFRRQRP